jgi:serine/threonine protein kinase
MTSSADDSGARWKKVANHLESGALVFAAPLLKAAPPEGAPQLAEPIAQFVRQAARWTSSSDSAPGSLPTETGTPYVLQRMLARGGMATVYLARDVKHDRNVAIKVLDAELAARLGAKRFVREIRLTARLQHPHVLGLLDSGVFGPEAGTLAGRPYYVMPYVEGESLRARLARSPLTLSEAVRVLREVADALAYAHELGVIHRDIKPENILLSREHAVVADFGIAKALAASQRDLPNDDALPRNGADAAVTQVSTLVGTPAYMAPEQATRGSSVDYRADLYAWGVIAYELLAGRYPFGQGRSPYDVIAVRAREAPIPLRDVAPNVPPRLAALVMQCMSKRVADRPASAAAVLVALDKSAANKTPTAFASSRRRFGVALALGVLLSAGALASNAYRHRQPILIVATGNAVHDLRSLQAAVDRGGDVTLQGHFSFAQRPTKPIAPLLASGYLPPAAEILISKAVTIVGARDERGEMATIEGGTVPFYIDAPGERVRIRGVRFVRPTATAILVRAVSGLEISKSTIEGLVPYSIFAEGIVIDTRGSMPFPDGIGNPEAVSGKILITNNEINGSGGRRDAATAGIRIFNIGLAPNRLTDVELTGNTITNVSSSAINIRRVDGSVRIMGNTVRTDTAEWSDVDAVRLVRARSILMANNTVECRWANAPAIQIFSPIAEWPTTNTRVEDNEIIMSPLAGAPLGDYSAGISIRGYASGDTVRHNRIRGHALAALSTYAFRGGAPADNAFLDNRLDGFESTLADIFVGSGVARTHIRGRGRLVNQGIGTVHSP